MLYERLVSLAQSYPKAERSRMMELARLRAIRDEQEVLELAAIAAEAQVDSLLHSVLEPAHNPLLRRAFELQYPTVDPDSLSGHSAKSLSGYIDGVKGKYFEVLVEDKLNAGEAVGGLKLAAGQVARLAESPTNRGWDLEVVDKSGRVVEQLQMKAIVQYGQVYEALSKYPHIKVLTPEPMDRFGDNVLSADMSHAHLEDASESYVEDLGDGLVENVFQSVAGFAVQAIPVTTVLLAGGTAGARFLMGRATLQEAMSSGGSRVVRSTAYNVVAQALAVAGLGPAAIPATMALRVTETRVRGHLALRDKLDACTAELDLLLREKAA